MPGLQGNQFYFSEGCYFDRIAHTVVDLIGGSVVRNTPIAGAELAVLNMLIEAYPHAVTVEQLSDAICFDPEETRKVISRLKKRHDQIQAWIPRARHGTGEYRLLAPASVEKPQFPEPQIAACSLKNTGICVRPNFVPEARQEVFAQLDGAFRENHVVFLHGIGGIGKSEAAKHWALQKRREGLFSTVVFAQLNTEADNSNVRSLITDDATFVISGAFQSRTNEETVDGYFHRKLAKIKQITDEKTLIIIDNYDIDDPQMELLFTGSYRLLVTTRNKPKGYDFPVIPVREIQNPNHLKKVFFKNLEGEREDICWDDPYVEKLFECVSNHTLTVEIIAKSLVNSADTPQSLFHKIGSHEQHQRILNVEGVVERSFSEELLSPFDCVRILFNLSRLESDRDFEYKSQVLAFMAAMPTRGIELSLFNKWSDNHIIRAKNSLVRKSWLRQDSVKGIPVVSMHPLIREVIWHDLKPSIDGCPAIIHALTQDDQLYIDGLYHQPKTVKEQYDQIAWSLLSAFPAEDLSNFDFYIKLQRVFHACANIDGAYRLACTLKLILERMGRTETWQYAYILYRIGGVHAALNRDRENGMRYFKQAEQLMQSTARTNEEKMWLALLYREMAITDCRDEYLFDPSHPISVGAAQDWLHKGEVLVSDLLRQGFVNTNLRIYWGTLCVWRSKIQIRCGNLEQAEELITAAVDEFVRLGYFNVLDKAAIEDVKALIYTAKGMYTQAVHCLKAASAVYIGGFGEYHRGSVDRAMKLAAAYQNNGQRDEAVAVLTHYLQISMEMYGKEAPMTAAVSNQLAQLLEEK